MYWIALLPAHEDELSAWSWRALQFTPRVALLEEALLLEASTSLRLWGGRKRLLKRLFDRPEPLAKPHWAEARTGLQALGMLRLQASGVQALHQRIDDLPLQVLSAARDHVPPLERIGCRSWGDLRRLPRSGVTRRFGAALFDALDQAYGDKPEQYRWLQLPESFDMKVELPALATSAGELMWSGQRLLSQMQVWLQARNRGVLSLEIEWTLDLRRLDGVILPGHEQLAIRTARPTQDIEHLRRLLGEHLNRATLAAPANYLRLRSLETLSWQGSSRSLLPQGDLRGEALHQFIERLSVRLGAANVVIPQLHADHRPERMQSWMPANSVIRQNVRAAKSASSQLPCDALYPPWLLPRPLRLEVHADKPHYLGPLRLLVGPQRIETGWWDAGAQGPAARDYFIARSEQAGLLWVYRERLANHAIQQDHTEPVRWFLHGLYA